MENGLKGFLLIAAAVIGIGSLAHGADEGTPALRKALQEQWSSDPGTQVAISALETYANDKDSKAALAVLKKGRRSADQRQYESAAASMGDRFWQLLAGFTTGTPGCAAARSRIEYQFANNQKSLSDAARVERDKGNLAGLVVLLRTAPDDPEIPRSQAREIYRGCYSVNPSQLFAMVNQTLGTKR